MEYARRLQNCFTSHLSDDDAEGRQHSHTAVLDLSLAPLLDVSGLGAVGQLERVEDLRYEFVDSSSSEWEIDRERASSLFHKSSVNMPNMILHKLFTTQYEYCCCS